MTWLRWAAFGMSVWGGVLAGCGSGSDPQQNNEPEGVRSSAFMAGARLTAVLAEASDGTATFLHWRDKLLGLHCRFQPVEGGFRCLPFERSPGLVVGIEGSFGDAQCTQPLLQASAESLAGQPTLVRLLNTPHGWEPSTYFSLGTAYSEPVVYRKSNNNGCQPEPVQGETFQTLVPFATEGFAGGQFVTKPVTSGAAPLYILGEDGAREPRGFRDTMGVDCWPHETTDGLRCLPIDFGWASRSGAFADSQCVSPVAEAKLATAARRTSLPFVFFDDATKRPESVTSVHRGGGKLNATFNSLAEGGCAMSEAVSNRFAIGEAIPLASFAPSSLSQIKRSSGLAQDVAQVNGVTMGTFGLPKANTLGGYECELATTPDGAVRCVPPIENTHPEYADSGCTDVVWHAWVPVISVAAEPVPDAALLPLRANDVVLPKVTRILSGGVDYEGPVYERKGTACVLHEGVPHRRFTYFRFANDVSPKDLVAMPIVER